MGCLSQKRKSHKRQNYLTVSYGGLLLLSSYALYLSICLFSDFYLNLSSLSFSSLRQSIDYTSSVADCDGCYSLLGCHQTICRTTSIKTSRNKLAQIRFWKKARIITNEFNKKKTLRVGPRDFDQLCIILTYNTN